MICCKFSCNLLIAVLVGKIRWIRFFCDWDCQQVIFGEQFNGMPLTFPKLEAFVNEKEKYRKIIAHDSTNITTLPQVSIAAGSVSNMHATISHSRLWTLVLFLEIYQRICFLLLVALGIMVFLQTWKTDILLFITWWIQVKFPMLESSLAITSSSSLQMSLEEHFNTSQSYQNSSNL